MLWIILSACVSKISDSSNDKPNDPHNQTSSPSYDPNEPAGEPGNEPTSEPTSEPTNEPGSEPWSPSEGHWTYGTGQLIESTCPEGDDGGTSTDPIGFNLVQSNNNEITITADGSTDSVVCAMQGMDFTCQKTTTTVVVPADLGIDVVDIDIKIETDSNGFFTDNATMTTLFTLTSTCLDVESNIFGISCGSLASDGYLPCVVRFSAEANAD
jgi:hypothetical protein